MTTLSSRTAGAAAALLSSSWLCHGFTATNNRHHHTTKSTTTSLRVMAPPGSGYVRTDIIEDEDSDLTHPELLASDVALISPRAFPSTYEPMLEYPGTMRPGRTPENMPYHDLPGLGINDPDPVPWPHFQEIEWHHRWDPPHEQALAMEEFIEVQGRWASVEEEAEMRMGMRRGVRERREMEETDKGGSGEQMVIMDDDDEEEDDGGAEGNNANIGIGLGEGVEALLKSAADTKARAEAAGEVDDEEDDEEEEGSDDFLLDLGLGGEEEEEEEETPVKMKAGAEDKGKGEDVDLDFQLGFDLDGDDEEDEAEEEEEEEAEDDEEGDFFDDDDEEISIDDYTKEVDGEGGGDTDNFDDAGFDYGDQ